MKHLKRIISIFLLTIVLGGCLEKVDKNQESTLTIITGNVRNLEVYPNTKEVVLNIIDFRGKKTIFKDSIKSDGTFKIEFDLYKTQDISIYPIVGEIIAHPGDSINLRIDFKDIGNIQFFGDSEKSNTDLNKYLNSNYCMFDFRNQETNLSFYKSFCDSVKAKAEQKRQEYIKEINPSPEIRNWTKDYINIKYQVSLLKHPHYLAYKNKIKYHDLDIPNDYYNFLENIEHEFSNLIINTNIYELLNSYTGSFAQRTIKDTTLRGDNYLLVLINELLDKHKQSLFKQLLIGNIFYQRLNQNDLEFFTNNKAFLGKNLHESFLKAALNNYYKDLQKQLKNPEINSTAILSKLNGTSGKTLIDSIWLQNQGKVLYVDFWATWCGPCKAEMPNSNILKQKLAEEEIEFVYLCIDSEEKQWKLALSQMQLDGKHYLSDKEQSRNIRNAFEIKGIPHYMLVNKDGHIIESGSYLRPTNPETINKIETLLNEK